MATVTLPPPGERVDRNSQRGLLTEHVMGTGERTICGLGFDRVTWQTPAGNPQCRRCAALLHRRTDP